MQVTRPSDEDSDYTGGPRSQQDSRFFIVRDQLCFCWDTVPFPGVGLVLKTEDGAPFASLPEAKIGFFLLIQENVRLCLNLGAER